MITDVVDGFSLPVLCILPFLFLVDVVVFLWTEFSMLRRLFYYCGGELEPTSVSNRS